MCFCVLSWESSAEVLQGGHEVIRYGQMINFQAATTREMFMVEATITDYSSLGPKAFEIARVRNSLKLNSWRSCFTTTASNLCLRQAKSSRSSQV